MKKIAIITPVFNSRNFVEECMYSVACLNKGTYDIAHVLVDDGSDDDSWDVIQRHMTKNSQAFQLEKNMGGSYARNFGAKHTDADLIFCLDADDVIFQNAVVCLADYLYQGNCNWVYGDFLRGDREMGYLIGQDYYGHDFSGVADVLASMFSGEHFFQQNCLYSKEIFDQVGGFNEKIRHFQDFDLFTRFLLSGHKPCYLSGSLYLHRNHDTNLSRLNKRDSDPELHRLDVRSLFYTLEKEICSKLSSEQIEKIVRYVSR